MKWSWSFSNKSSDIGPVAIANHNQKVWTWKLKSIENYANFQSLPSVFPHLLPQIPSRTATRQLAVTTTTTTTPTKGRKRTHSCKSQELTFPANIDFNSIFISSPASNSASASGGRVQLPTRARGAARPNRRAGQSVRYSKFLSRGNTRAIKSALNGHYIWIKIAHKSGKRFLFLTHHHWQEIALKSVATSLWFGSRFWCKICAGRRGNGFHRRLILAWTIVKKLSQTLTSHQRRAIVYFCGCILSRVGRI